MKACRPYARVIAFLRSDPPLPAQISCVSSQLTAPFPGERKKSVGENPRARAALASPDRAMVRAIPACRSSRHDQRCRKRLFRVRGHGRPGDGRDRRHHRRERGLLRRHGGHRVAPPGWAGSDGAAGQGAAHHPRAVLRVRPGGGHRLAARSPRRYVPGAVRHRWYHQRFTSRKDHGRCRVLRRRDREFRGRPASRGRRTRAGRCGGAGQEGYERRTACTRRFWRWTSTWWPRRTAA